MELYLDLTYEDGVLKPVHPLPWPEHSRVRIVVPGGAGGRPDWSRARAFVDPELVQVLRDDPQFVQQQCDPPDADHH